MSSTATASPVSQPACAAASTDQSEWFRQEVHAHDTHLKAYLRTSFPTVRDFDDIVQESYLRIWRRQSVQPVRTAKALFFSLICAVHRD